MSSKRREQLDVYVILDNYATHKRTNVKAWVANHKRFHLYFTPTYSSWLNQVEQWFALITQRAIRRRAIEMQVATFSVA